MRATPIIIRGYERAPKVVTEEKNATAIQESTQTTVYTPTPWHGDTGGAGYSASSG